MADKGTIGNGYPDIMNLDNHLIYEVKGGTLQPDGSVGFPSNLTVAYGWALVRWYAARANRDSDWGAVGTWSPGDLTLDPQLEETIAACGGISCVEQMPDGRWITIAYAQGGVLSYYVTTKEPEQPNPIPSTNYYPSLYAKYLLALGGIAIVSALVTGAVSGWSGSSPNPGGYEGGYGYTYEYNRVCSFTATTFVETPQGEKPIGQLVVGDQVMAYNIDTGMIEVQSVEQVWIHNDTDLMDVTMTFMLGHQSRQELLHTTSLHPFLTQERGFVPVAQLQVGMHLLRADGSVGTITRIQAVPETMVMYNLEVTNDHTFVVGAGQWIVHNSCEY